MTDCCSGAPDLARALATSDTVSRLFSDCSPVRCVGLVAVDAAVHGVVHRRDLVVAAGQRQARRPHQARGQRCRSAAQARGGSPESRALTAAVRRGRARARRPMRLRSAGRTPHGLAVVVGVAAGREGDADHAFDVAAVARVHRELAEHFLVEQVRRRATACVGSGRRRSMTIKLNSRERTRTRWPSIAACADGGHVRGGEAGRVEQHEPVVRSTRRTLSRPATRLPSGLLHLEDRCPARRR